METVITTAVTVLGVIAASLFTYRVSIRRQRADANQQMIDQHQEDILSLRLRVASLEQVARIQGDYIGQLRRHIADGQPPPPPPWPMGLIT